MKNHITERYEQVGLPATLPDEQREAWESWLAGEGAPLRLLPTNGERCREMTLGGGVGCGYRILIDGTCPNQNEHLSFYCRRLVQRALPETGVGFCELKAGHDGPCDPEPLDDDEDL